MVGGKSRWLMGLAMLIMVVESGCQPKGDNMEEEEFDFAKNEPVQVDPAVTKELFLQWRSPRPGKTNPERMNNPVWEWLIKTRINPYLANEAMQGPSSVEAGPGWCFDRFGQSSTPLPDGRVIYIGGEHEDYYDPDFYIYNDVVVQHPVGSMDLFGYPREIFPPTDSHSATVVGDRIVIIGSLGYAEDRRPGQTQVLLLDLKSFAISAVTTSGNSPGWIHKHTAALSEDGRSILISHGKVERDDTDSLVENIDEWRLNLENWNWERLTERRWSRWTVIREDESINHLFDYEEAIWEKECEEVQGKVEKLFEKNNQTEIPTLQEELGKEPDLKLFGERYRPPVPHVVLPEVEDEHRVHRIKINEVTVRYVEDISEVQMTVEGELPEEILEKLTRDLLEKMTALENAPCQITKL
jgi:hypothetical protein